MILVVIFLPLLGFLFSGLFSRHIGRTGSCLLTTGITFVNVFLTIILFYKVSVLHRVYLFNLGTWIYSDLFQVNWNFYIDNLTITMLLVVNIISALVHLYSSDYMSHDPHVPRFMSYLSLFTFFMLLLVTGGNFVILFLGWEGVGLCSYLLISFWYTRLQANKAAIKALIVNRIADFALTIGMLSIFFVFKSLDFHVVFPLVPFFLTSTFVFLGYNLPVITVICSLLFIGAMGKSAQIGLHTWLPDAMEGPTPVSALIHAATMVTAGVFLIIKCSPLFEYVPTVLSIITCVGATTAFFSATIGLVQNDIKKVIAYSTCSQLGYMIFACGLSNYHISLFHLANHAFFKALLFLSAGAIIHSLSNEQDMRKFGDLILILPFTSIMFLIGSLSLMGFPFLTGFYSKDLILELALSTYTVEGSFAYCLGLITAFFTSFYSFRVFHLTFSYKNNSFRSVMKNVHELPWKMAFSLSVLSVGSIFLGYFAKDLFVGLGTDFWNHSILMLAENNTQLDAEFFGLPHAEAFGNDLSFENITYTQRWIKLLPFFSSLMAMGIVFFLFSHRTMTVTPKTNLVNLFQTPYLLQQTHMELSQEDFYTELVEKSRENLEEVQDDDIKKVNDFYLTQGLAEKSRVFPLSNFLNDPLRPRLSLKKKTEDLFYEKLIWELSNEKVTPWSTGFKSYLRQLYRFLTYKWYFDAIYNEFVNRPLLREGYLGIFGSLDKGLFELVGPFGTASSLITGNQETRHVQSGVVYSYGYFILIFLLISFLCLRYFMSDALSETILYTILVYAIL